MSEFLPALLVIVVGTSIAVFQAVRFSRYESSWIIGSFAAHVFTSLFQVWFTNTMYGGGDPNMYASQGELVAATMRIDPGQFVPEVFKLLMQFDSMLPVDVFGPGTSTGSMIALAGFITFVTGGALYTGSLVVGIGAHFGQVALYRAFSSAFPHISRKRLLVAALFVPSTVFWSCGLIKEGASMIGLGYAVLGLERFLRGERFSGLLPVLFGCIVVSRFKSYILVGLVAATVAHVFFRRPKGQELLSRPLNVLAGAVIAALGTAAILRLFPQYSLESVAQQAAYYQEMGTQTAAGSNYSIGDATRTSFAGQIAFAPVALVTSLFRPFIFEARSPQVLVNTLETTAVLYMIARLAWRQKIAATWARVVSEPMLVFALVFCLIFGVGVGLTTTNMGTLSRYRMPLVPFLWLFVLVLTVPQRGTVTAASPALARPRVHARAPVHAAAMRRSVGGPAE